MSRKLFKVTYLKEICKQYGFSPSKKYGQNFLIQEWPIKKILEAAGVTKKDTVIEIGPGFGILTFALAERAGHVIAFEIEKKLESYWKEIINKEINGDKIEMKWGNALNNLSLITYHLSSYKVVANLPYQITSQVLRTLLELENKPESITIMVQKEVAERICACPPNMSLLAVSVQYYGQPKIMAKISRGNFWPEPKVDSSILVIRRISKISILSSERFFQVVRTGFANKRKQLHKNLAVGLKIDDEKIKNILLDICDNEKARAEELSLGQWRELVKKLEI